MISRFAFGKSKMEVSGEKFIDIPNIQEVLIVLAGLPGKEELSLQHVVQMEKFPFPLKNQKILGRTIPSTLIRWELTLYHFNLSPPTRIWL